MTDYKNSAEGRIVTAKYQDILHLSRPEPSYRHPRMPVAGRAKIFSPFAALRGYEEEIAEEDWKKNMVPKKFLSEEKSLQISVLLSRVEKGSSLSVRFFQEDMHHSNTPPLGIYKEVSGIVTGIDSVFQKLVISDGETETVISFESLAEIKLPE